MISLETFRKIVETIKKQEELDDKLTQLLVDPDCCGWISTGSELIDTIIDLLQDIFGDEYETIEWWWYEINDNHKFIYEDMSDGKYQIEFDLNDIDSLYYYLIKDYKNVPQRVVEKDNTYINSNEYKDTVNEVLKWWGIDGNN